MAIPECFENVKNDRLDRYSCMWLSSESGMHPRGVSLLSVFIQRGAHAGPIISLPSNRFPHLFF